MQGKGRTSSRETASRPVLWEQETQTKDLLASRPVESSTLPRWSKAGQMMIASQPFETDPSKDGIPTLNYLRGLKCP